MREVYRQDMKRMMTETLEHTSIQHLFRLAASLVLQLRGLHFAYVLFNDELSRPLTSLDTQLMGHDF